MKAVTVLDDVNTQRLESVDIGFYRSSSPLINDAVDKLVAKIYTYKKHYAKKTILLTGCGSANGTSMIAINLSIALSLAGWTTLLVDADFRKGPQYKRAGSELMDGLSNYLNDQVQINSIIYRTNHPNLKYVPCGTSTTSAVLLLCSDGMTRFIQDMGSKYDFVIVDSPSLTVVPDASVLFLNMDGIALVASLNATTKKQLAIAKREVEKTGDKYYGLIINCVDKNQYRHFFPQQGYFEDEVLVRKHQKWVKNQLKSSKQGEKSWLPRIKK